MGLTLLVCRGAGGSSLVPAVGLVVVGRPAVGSAAAGGTFGRPSARGQRTTGVTPRRYPRRRASWCSARCSPATGRRRRAGALDHRGRAGPGAGRGGGARGARSGRADDVVEPRERRRRRLGPLPRHVGRALRGDGGPCRPGLALLLPEPEGRRASTPSGCCCCGPRATCRPRSGPSGRPGGWRPAPRPPRRRPVPTHRRARPVTGRRRPSRRVRHRRTGGRRSGPTSGRRGSEPGWTSSTAGWPTRSGGAWPPRTRRRARRGRARRPASSTRRPGRWPTASAGRPSCWMPGRAVSAPSSASSPRSTRWRSRGAGRPRSIRTWP